MEETYIREGIDMAREAVAERNTRRLAAGRQR